MTKEALKLALEALTYIYTETTADEDELIDQAITAVKEALAQPTSGDYALGYSIGFGEGHSAGKALAQPKEQKPVAWMVWGEDNVPSLTFKKPSDKYVFDSLYITPPHRPWVGLTDEEAIQMHIDCNSVSELFDAIDAKLKHKNTRGQE